MVKHTPGKIFLAEQRGLLENPRFQRYSTFRFGEYAAEHKEPFGDLHGLNEETLAGGECVVVAAPQASQLLVLPVTGEVKAQAGAGAPALVDVGEMYLTTVAAGDTVRFTNPYESHLISFLHVWLKAAPEEATKTSQVFAFDSWAMVNQLAEARAVAPAPDGAGRPFVLSLGQFAGRAETSYQLRSEANRFFAFVLAGAFEVEGRLLHEKDGLALWGTPAVELEALSNHAVVLVLEMAG
ncbi:MAG TPA: hypothetical protein VF630_16100 [Hymenobacter sp.]|jgi:hypothetical protein